MFVTFLVFSDNRFSCSNNFCFQTLLKHFESITVVLIQYDVSVPYIENTRSVPFDIKCIRHGIAR